MVGRGASQVLSLQKGEGGGGCSIDDWGRDAQNVSTQALEVLAIVKGGATSFHPLKGRGGGAKQVLSCIEVGLEQRFSHILAPPPPHRY